MGYRLVVASTFGSWTKRQWGHWDYLHYVNVLSLAVILYLLEGKVDTYSLLYTLSLIHFIVVTLGPLRVA